MLSTRIRDVDLYRLYKTNRKIYNQLHKLTLGDGGLMQGKMDSCIINKLFYRAIFLTNSKGTIFSWCLMFAEAGEDNLYFFTRESSRQRGYATRLLKFTLKKYYPMDFSIYSKPLYDKITFKKYKERLTHYQE